MSVVLEPIRPPMDVKHAQRGHMGLGMVFPPPLVALRVWLEHMVLAQVLSAVQAVSSVALGRTLTQWEPLFVPCA